jgi:hypothetical protein
MGYKKKTQFKDSREFSFYQNVGMCVNGMKPRERLGAVALPVGEPAFPATVKLTMWPRPAGESAFPASAALNAGQQTNCSSQ